MTSSVHRKGWCPGALRPMLSGDGLIVRLRIVGGVISPDLARALADCAQRYGNGLLDLSSRANLQLRGVTDTALPALQTHLAALDLLDSDPRAEAVRNILASPLAGLDPSARLDIRPLIRLLDEELKADRRLHELPGKFLFLVDDGGDLPLPREQADVAFIAVCGAPAAAFAVYCGGRLAGSCSADRFCETALGCAQIFIRFRREEKERRMTQLVDRIGIGPIAAAADLAGPPNEAAIRPRQKLLGLRRSARFAVLGLGIPFGQLDADTLRYLADETAAIGGRLHLSPWWAVFISAERIDVDLVERMRAKGFLPDDDAPIRSVAACTGAPACWQGRSDVRTDAQRLASLARKFAAPGVALHVSACPKGCAYPHAAPITLVGHAGGYDLVVNGRAGDAPVLRGLGLDALEELLPRLATHAAAERVALAQAFAREVAR